MAMQMLAGWHWKDWKRQTAKKRQKNYRKYGVISKNIGLCKNGHRDIYTPCQFMQNFPSGKT
jgi:hypothetical protein